MRRRFGLTEQLWDSLSREQQISWKFFLYAVAVITSLMVDTTGIVLVDWLLKACTGFIVLLIIESQRNLSRYKRSWFRKMLLRSSVFLGTSALGLLVFAFFITVSFQVTKVFIQVQLQQIDWMYANNPIAFVIFTLMVFFAVGKAIFMHFQQLDFSKLLTELRNNLKRLLVDRPVYMSHFPLFALFEFSVILFAYLYVSMASAIVSTIRATVLL